MRAARPAAGRLLRAGVLAGVAAAVVTTVVAVVAKAADVSLEVDGTEVPVPAFAWWSVIGTVMGVALVLVLGERRRFVAVTAVGTALSLVPPILAGDDAATRLVLVVTHLLAAAVIVPVLARLTDAGQDTALSSSTAARRSPRS